MPKSKLTLISKRQSLNSRWPVDCVLERIDEFDEILIIGKKKNENGFIRFSSGLKDSFWWVGVLERMKYILMEEGIVGEE